jgi:alpha-tubulin suppressor-like RCC1 family protein
MTEENENKYLPSLTLLEKLRIRDQDSYEPCFLSLGVTHSALITRSGDLFTSGSKLDGQLGQLIQAPAAAQRLLGIDQEA